MRLWQAGIVALALAVLSACGPAPPLASFNIVFHGDLAPLRPPGITSVHSLRVALVWGGSQLYHAINGGDVRPCNPTFIACFGQGEPGQ